LPPKSHRRGLNVQHHIHVLLCRDAGLKMLYAEFGIITPSQL